MHYLELLRITEKMYVCVREREFGMHWCTSKLFAIAEAELVQSQDLEAQNPSRSLKWVA